MTMNRGSIYYLVNGITMYRLVSAPFLLILAFVGELSLFKWLIAFSFFTDAIDGPLSRKFKVTSVFGARLDSVADDATVLTSIVALFILELDFISSNWMSLTSLAILFIIQTISALVAYGKVTSFHTYLAKLAAVMQAVFFLLTFFTGEPVVIAFYLALVITAIQLIEEIVLVIVLPKWQADIKGLYWVLTRRNNLVPKT